MGDNAVHIQLVQNRIRVLSRFSNQSIPLTASGAEQTLLRLAVKTTTSYSSPIFFKKLSTPGRLMT